MKEFYIRRNIPDGVYRLLDIFTNFDQSPALTKIFPNATSDIATVRVRVGRTPKYMRVMDDDGSIAIGKEYLREGNWLHLYLDLIHETTHVRQHRQGLELYDDRYRYIDRPTEIEAMTIAVEEARRLNLAESEIAEYLDVPWITREEHTELLTKLGIPRNPGNGH